MQTLRYDMFEGIFHAVAFPAMTGAWGAWAPPLEKTQLMGIYFSGLIIIYTVDVDHYLHIYHVLKL